MDDPFNAILFAEDLTAFILNQHGLYWSDEIGIRKFRYTISRTRFNGLIGLCVLDIMNIKAGTIRSCYDALVRKGVRDVEVFRFECMVSTVFHFSDGYRHELYLNLCAMLIGLAVLYFKDGNQEMASGASHVLAYVLNFYIYQLEFNPRNDWFNLAVKAQTTRRSLMKNADAIGSSTKEDVS